MSGLKVHIFTDTLVLITEDPGDMTILLKCCEGFFDENRLLVNSTKCVSLKVLPVKGKKSMKLVTSIHRYW